MTHYLVIAAIGCAALLTLFFSTLTYSLRGYSRARLSDILERRGLSDYLEPTMQQADDLIFVTAFCRLFSNILVLIGVLRIFHETGIRLGLQYLGAIFATGAITLFCSVMIPHALASHAAEPLIANFIHLLHGLRAVLSPLTKLMHGIDAIVRKAAVRASPNEPEKLEHEIEQEILSAVDEGAKEGVVDEEEREMIASVIAFHNTQVGQIMTARPEIFAIEVNASLDQVKEKIRASGHSRIPVIEKDLDHIIGVLYARDLVDAIGVPLTRLDIRSTMRLPIYVPETKPLRDLLKDFRIHKVHIAIVLDEYGGTAGLVTIEDIFQELVGEISDEHEPRESPLFKQIDERTAEADGRMYIDELNRLFGLNLPDDAGYDTLGGFISTTLGRIPETGATFDHEGVRYTILDAEPQKVNRVKIEMLPQPVEEPSSANAK